MPPKVKSTGISATKYNPQQKIAKSPTDILKKTNKLKPQTKLLLSDSLITGIIKAETKRLSGLEKLGIDGSTIGRGQLSQAAYSQVKSNLEKELEMFCQNNNISKSGKLSTDIKNKKLEKFIILAYLALRINEGVKPERGPEEALKFGIGKYFGAFATLRKAQISTGNNLNFKALEPYLKKNKPDTLSYINEVAAYGKIAKPTLTAELPKTKQENKKLIENFNVKVTPISIASIPIINKT